MYQTRVINDLSTEPVTLAEAKEFMQIDYNDFDALITKLIKSARLASEKFTGLSYGEKTIKLMNKGCSQVTLPFGPVQTITSVKDQNNNNLDYTSFGYDNPIITIKQPISGILGSNGFNGVFEVEYITGFTDCPEDLKEAIKKRVETAFQYRSDSSSEEINEAINQSIDLEFAYRVSPIFGL